MLALDRPTAFGDVAFASMNSAALNSDTTSASCDATRTARSASATGGIRLGATCGARSPSTSMRLRTRSTSSLRSLGGSPDERLARYCCVRAFKESASCVTASATAHRARPRVSARQTSAAMPTIAAISATTVALRSVRTGRTAGGRSAISVRRWISQASVTPAPIAMQASKRERRRGTAMLAILTSEKYAAREREQLPGRRSSCAPQSEQACRGDEVEQRQRPVAHVEVATVEPLGAGVLAGPQLEPPGGVRREDMSALGRVRL